MKHQPRTISRVCVRLSTLAGVALALSMLGWSAPGHRTITEVAIASLPESFPQWVRDPVGVAKASYDANEPDRWRGTRLPTMSNENNADHYMDVEELAKYGLSLDTLPHLRYEFVDAVVRATPGSSEVFDPQKIGMLPYAIMEHYAKLQASFNNVRILVRLDDPKRALQLEEARENAYHEMGQLSHFVGDAAQPLHETIHHHGWVGANPNGYTTSHGFHSFIDYAIVKNQGLGPEGLTPYVKPMADIPSDGVWDATIALMKRGYEAVEPLYKLQKSGDLDREPGRKFIGERLADAASVLAGLYQRAWLDAAPTDKDVKDWVRYNSFEEEYGYTAPREAATP